jgi:hypothetical protein
MAAYLILAVKQYRFAQEGTGEIVSGVTVTYCDEPTYDANTKGFTPMKITAPLDTWKDFDKIPALYEMDFSLKPDAKGKAQLVFRAAKFKKEIAIPLLSS